MSAIGRWVCWFQSIDWTPEAITAAATVALAFLTLTLATGTFFLWLATRRLVKEAEKTAEHQLRAYISVTPTSLWNVNPAKNLVCLFVFQNDGLTPAHEVEFAAVVRFLPYPLPTNFPFPVLPASLSSFAMSPRTKYGGSAVDNGHHFSQAEYIEIFQGPAQGGQRLYIFGQIDYWDVFRKKKQFTRFCASLPGRHDFIPMAQAENWAAIATILMQPGFGISFELTNQHNQSD